MMYLTGCSNEQTRAIAYQVNMGLMIAPRSRYEKQIPYYPAFAIDNGCFTESQGIPFVLPAYLDFLERMRPYQSKCLFATAPDVYNPTGWHDGVTIAEATLARSLPVIPQIRRMGYAAALVAQNGLENLDIPWGAFDVLFIGGDTSWKLGWDALSIIRQAKARNMPVHMGRVNTASRIAKAMAMGCDTCDGTTFKGKKRFAVNFPRIMRGLGQHVA